MGGNGDVSSEDGDNETETAREHASNYRSSQPWSNKLVFRVPPGHGKSCKVMGKMMIMSCNFYNCTELFFKSSISCKMARDCR